MLNCHLLFFSPAFAPYYCHDTLDEQDQKRLLQTPSLEHRLQWQVSRAAKHYIRQHYPNRPFCLTHKIDHVAIAIGQTQKPGIDMETLKERDFFALAKHIANKEEQRYLAQSSHPTLTFYQLWTAKEALIKAENLRFPTDMREVGYHIDTTLQLRSPSQQKYHFINCLIDNTFLITAAFSEHCRSLTLHTEKALTSSALLGNLTTVFNQQSDIA